MDSPFIFRGKRMLSLALQKKNMLWGEYPSVNRNKRDKIDEIDEDVEDYYACTVETNNERTSEDQKNIDERTCDSVGNIFGNEEPDGDENTLCALNDHVSKILASYDNVCISSTNDIILSEKRASHGNDASVNNTEIDFDIQNVEESRDKVIIYQPKEVIHDKSKNIPTEENEALANEENRELANEENEKEPSTKTSSTERVRKKRKREEVETKHPLLKPCFCKMKGCSIKLDEDIRREIYKGF